MLIVFSIWSIDLCYLLHRFNIIHSYTTITIGVNPKFNDENYGPIIGQERLRVQEKFQNAKSKGLKIHRQTVSNEVLLEHLAYHGPVIVLTNESILQCKCCHAKQSESPGDHQ